METDEVRGRPLDPFGSPLPELVFTGTKEFLLLGKSIVDFAVSVAPKTCMGD